MGERKRQNDDPAVQLPRSPRVRPYLGKKARLCLAPISLAYLSLFALGMSMVLLLVNLQNQVDDTKLRLQNTCAGVEQVASFAVSAPHYAANLTNRATVKTIEDSVALTTTSLNLVIDIAEALVRFGIYSIMSPTLCLYQFVIRAALDVLIDAAQAIDAAVGSVTQVLKDAVSGAISAAQAVASLIHKSIDVDVSALDADFSGFCAPADWLTNLNNSIPTLGETADAFIALFDTPLEVVRTVATQALANESAGLSPYLFPIPGKKSVTFCAAHLNTSFVDEVGDSVRKWAVWGLEGLAIGAVLLALALVGIEWIEYTLMYRLVKRIRRVWVPPTEADAANPSSDRLLGFLQAVEHPVLSVLFSCTYGAGTWFITYITYPPAMIYLFIGALGIGVIQLQLFLLQTTVLAEARSIIAGGLDELVADIGSQVNTSLLSTSQEFADACNQVLLGIQTDINTKALGWAEQSIQAANNTINTFVGNIENATTSFFSSAGSWGDLVDNLVKCIIGEELNEVEAALTWLQQNAQVSLPTVSDTVFVISGSQVDSITSGLSGSAQQTALESLINDFVNRYESVLIVTRWVFIGYVGVWGVVVIMGIVGVLWEEAWEQIQWIKIKRTTPGTTKAHSKKVDSDDEKPSVKYKAKSLLAGLSGLFKRGNVEDKDTEESAGTKKSLLGLFSKKESDAPKGGAEKEDSDSGNGGRGTKKSLFGGLFSKKVSQKGEQRKQGRGGKSKSKGGSDSGESDSGGSDSSNSTKRSSTKSSKPQKKNQKMSSSESSGEDSANRKQKRKGSDSSSDSGNGDSESGTGSDGKSSSANSSGSGKSRRKARDSKR